MLLWIYLLRIQLFLYCSEAVQAAKSRRALLLESTGLTRHVAEPYQPREKVLSYFR